MIGPLTGPGPAAIQQRIAAIEQQVADHPAFAALLRRHGTRPEALDATAAAPRPDPSVSAPAGRAVEMAGATMPAPEGHDVAARLAGRLPDAAGPWVDPVVEAAQRHGVEPELLAGLVWAESGFDPSARSHAGAIGLAQLMPGTAAGLGVDPHDPLANLEGGARYLADMRQRFGSDRLALAAYNAGPNRVAQAGGVPDIAETRAYVDRVHGYATTLRG